MSVPAVIPFKPQNPKTRLSKVMDREEREFFAEMMLRDVISALYNAGCDPLILSTQPFCLDDVAVEVSTDGLNDALNGFLESREGPILIIMADLPLATPEAIRALVQTENEMAIVPGRGGGTNAIFLKEGFRFRVNYYEASFLKHIGIAQERGLSYDVIDSFRLHTDVDEESDLVELIIHGTGRSRKYIESLGFALTLTKGRVSVVRSRS
jgi:2-phospho-L-lactate guanylyltransferase